MRESIAETLTGLAVIIITGLFIFFSLSQTGMGTSSEAILYGARFDNVGGIATGTDVKVAGVKVGSIRSIALDKDTFEARVTFTVSKDIELGDDTSVRVQSDALLGGSYLGLEPGSGYGPIEICENTSLIFTESGCSEILYAQGSKDLLALAISAFSGGGGDSD